MKTSNLIALIGAALLFFMSIAFQSRIHYHVKKEKEAGYGSTVSETRDIGYFNRLYIDQKVKVVFTQDTTSLKVHAPKEVLDSVYTSIQDETLKIHLTASLSAKDTVQIFLSNPALGALELVGGHFETQGTLKTETFYLKMDKNSSCSLHLNTKVLEVSKDKEALLNLKGKTEEINFINQ